MDPPAMIRDAAMLAAAGAGLAGGAMNALAGGGTFATMPTLIALGLPAPVANATSNVALQPGAIASAWAYRRNLEPVGAIGVRTLGAVTFAGGGVGGLLLVATPTRVFDLVIPWLLLLATLALMAGRRGADWLAARLGVGVSTLVAVQLLLGVYGGYFGGGIGLMMTAAWGMLAGVAPHRLMAQRTLMLAIVNAAAAAIFIVSGMVRWPFCLPMVVGATLGGYAGARLGAVLPPAVIRVWTLTITAATTAAFFWRAYA